MWFNRIMELRLGEKFKIIKKIGSGAFGEIYKGKKEYSQILIEYTTPIITLNLCSLMSIGTNTQTGEDVAVKLVIHNFR